MPSGRRRYLTRDASEYLRVHEQRTCADSLYDEHVALGGRIVPFAGWEMPVQYTGIVDEHKAVRTAAGIFDVSHMGELRLRGEYAATSSITSSRTTRRSSPTARPCTPALQRARTHPRRPHRVPPHAGRLAHRLQRLEPREDERSLRPRRKDHCEFEDQSDATALIALQGPRAFDSSPSSGRTAAKLVQLKSFHFRDARSPASRCTPARTGYTGEDGVEIFCAWDDAPALWRALARGGQPARASSRRAWARATRSASRRAFRSTATTSTRRPTPSRPAWVGREGGKR